jgi:4a-hydroxytetrahydrobiopterin dehydratase
MPQLSRRAVSDRTAALGWRFLLGELRTAVPLRSAADGAALAGVITDEAGPAAASLRLDLRPAELVVALQDPATGWIGEPELAAAARITDALRAGGLAPAPAGSAHPVQLLEIAIDALDIPAVRPFWRAVLGYVAEPGADGDTDALVDPLRQGPAVWFQQLDAPRTARNRIHFDLSVGHDEAQNRIAAALAAGGALVSDRRAPAFWILADPEGNEICICTWQGRDEPQGDLSSTHS